MQRFILSLAIISCVTFFCQAQEDDFAKVGENEPFYVDPSEEIQNETADVPDYFRHFKKLSEVYQGYLVELLVTDYPVSRANDILARYGKVYYELDLVDEKYHYYLPIPFEEDNVSLDFYEKVIKPHNPDSKLIFREMKKKKKCKGCFNKF